MRIQTRYTIVEFLKVFVIALAAMTIFSLLVGVIAEAVRENLSLGPVVRMIPFILPVTMRFSVPTAALLAACTVFGRMSGENEIVAVKSMGISPLTVMTPAFVLSFLISVVAVWINDIAVSWGRPGAERVIMESIEQIAYGMLSTRGSYDVDRFSITVKRVDGRRLIMPIIKIRDADGSNEIVVAAREAELRYRPNENALSVVLRNGTITSSGDGDIIDGAFDDTIERVIELPSGRDRHGNRSPSDYAIRELPTERYKQSQTIAHLEGLMAADAAFKLVSGDIAGLDDPSWDQRVKKLDYARYRINRLKTEPWRRWANGFSCFFFVLVGVPLAIRLKHSDFVTSFFATFLPILLVYYPLMTYGVDRAKDGDFPQYACWLGNGACFVWALWLIKRVIRY